MIYKWDLQIMNNAIIAMVFFGYIQNFYILEFKYIFSHHTVDIIYVLNSVTINLINNELTY